MILVGCTFVFTRRSLGTHFFVCLMIHVDMNRDSPKRVATGKRTCVGGFF